MKFIKKIYTAFILVMMYAPIILLMVFSFNNSKLPVWNGFTLDWYTKMFHDAGIQQAFMHTIIIALTSAAVATIIGTFAAMGINRMRGWQKNVVMNITYIPLLSPDIVIGISLMMLFSVIKLPFGLPTLIVSHITFNIPYVILSVMPKLKQMNYNLYEAALDLGATPWYAFKKVIFPEIMPGVIAGAFIAFTLSIDDFVVSFFNKGAGVDTLPIKIYAMARKGVNPTINAISTIMFVTIISILLIMNLRADQKVKAKRLRQSD
ncbi:ABC transporter permease [Cellulosilyticum sp. I15G10I2]|uniref:ABC transporter permease n=1 Tax=Cellulosilyticum sp. I15G10I2 TaxID=1892843 RepID=UPI00085C6E96|nr:ABC transporter permease [Cellulosilyticum sp. I15G10I2]